MDGRYDRLREGMTAKRPGGVAIGRSKSTAKMVLTQTWRVRKDSRSRSSNKRTFGMSKGGGGGEELVGWDGVT